jgi:hypothetical protein
MTRFGRLSLIVAGVLAFSAGAAQAFTFTDQDGNTGPAQGYVDMQAPSSQRSAPSSRLDAVQQPGTLQSGNTTVQFGGSGNYGSFNQRYNSNNLFDPYARDGRQ